MIDACQTHRIARRRRGFTLIELLVAIGIIALLLAILTPAVIKAINTGKRHRLAGDMVTIAGALEEYKKDFGDYPQVDAPNTGFAVLGKALLGSYGDGMTGTFPAQTPDPNDPPTYVAGKVYMPGDCVQKGAGLQFVALVENANVDPSSDPAKWSPFTATDMSDGFGTRLRTGGKKVGPYVQPEKFRTRGCAFVDSNDKPILYFPARATKPNLTLPLQGGTPPFLNINGYAAGQNVSLFNANDNLVFFERPMQATPDTNTTLAMGRMAAVLGDINNDGLIISPEQAASTGPYLLWAAGPDGFYGPVTHPSTQPPGPIELGKCDDVTNFRQ